MTLSRQVMEEELRRVHGDPLQLVLSLARQYGDVVPYQTSYGLAYLLNHPDHIARVFEPGVRYPESEVNAFLRAFHPDYAMVRRYLVDEQFLSRDHGIYWRIGGSVDL